MALIAVLGGAGFHCPSLEPKYKGLLRESCQNALKSSSTAVDGVSTAIRVLEDNELTNAGYGSSLTRDGTVEMDAIIQDGLSMRFGAVGSVSGVRNPITAASELLRSQLDPPSVEKEAGLVQASFLSGPSVLQWCADRKTKVVKTCDPKDLIAPARHDEFVEYSTALQQRQKITLNSTSEGAPQDTVGAIFFHQDPMSRSISIASGSSSGGSVMKLPGRIGPAGVIGASCWCEQASTPEDYCCSVIVSGEGEYIMAKLVARSLACQVVNEMLRSPGDSEPLVINAASTAFKQLRLFDTDHQLGLVLVFVRPMSDEDSGNSNNACLVDVVWAHTTPSLAVGIAQTGSASPVVKISRLVSSSKASHQQRNQQQQQQQQQIQQHRNSALIEGRTFLVTSHCQVDDLGDH